MWKTMFSRWLVFYRMSWILNNDVILGAFVLEAKAALLYSSKYYLYKAE